MLEDDDEEFWANATLVDLEIADSLWASEFVDTRDDTDKDIGREGATGQSTTLMIAGFDDCASAPVPVDPAPSLSSFDFSMRASSAAEATATFLAALARPGLEKAETVSSAADSASITVLRASNEDEEDGPST